MSIIWVGQGLPRLNASICGCISHTA